jgi:hypothetical protein
MIIYSGGQTGVDRAAWDAAIEVGLPQDGWVPEGRLAEDGVIPEHYRCKKTDSRDYSVRTEMNLVEADATLILTFGEASGGTLRTIELCRKKQKPHLVFDLDREEIEQALQTAIAWLRSLDLKILNVAGPRGSFRDDVYATAKEFLVKALSNWQKDSQVQ